MKITFIVLLVIALALGGYVIFDILKGKKKAAAVEPAKDDENVVEEESSTIEEEVAATPQPQPEAEKIETDESQDEEDAQIMPEAEMLEMDENSGDEDTQIKIVTENGITQYIVIKYSKSFLAKLIQSNDGTKSYYSQLKNWLLSYEGVKARISWKCESFRLGRKTLAKLRFSGKTLSLYLALNALDYVDSKYKVENVADVKAYEDTPCMYRIKNDRRLKYSEELIDVMMNQNGITKIQVEDVDYGQQYPYETTEALLERKLIKELTNEDAQSGTAFRSSVTAQEVDRFMQDEVAITFIKKSDVKSDKTKTGFVNIDTLSEYFKSGEVVTLDEIKKRIKGFDKKTTYLKVLARGTLDKSLTVEADSFSIQAVKMIVLTGGTVIKR